MPSDPFWWICGVFLAAVLLLGGLTAKTACERNEGVWYWGAAGCVQLIRNE